MDNWYWASHPTEGFLPVKVKQTPDGYIARMANSEQFAVKKDDLMLASASSFISCDNLVDLEELNEPSLLHQLRERFEKDIIYTWVSTILISVNPFKQLPLYSSHVMSQYRDGLAQHKTLAPHVFTVADNLFKSLSSGNTAVTVSFSGESGAGKSINTMLTMSYLAEISSSHSGLATLGSAGQISDRVLSTNPILEAFGNSKTCRNNNSSRFGKFIKLQFSNKNEIIGAAIESYLLEKSRIVSQAVGDRNYHIFFQLLAGLDDSTKKELSLTHPFDYAITAGQMADSSNTSSKAAAKDLLASFVVDGMDDKEEWYRTQKSFEQIGLSLQQQKEICRVTAGLLHLGNIEFNAKGDSCEIAPQSIAALNTAASLLKLNATDLTNALVSQRKQMGRDWVTTNKKKEMAEAGLNASIKSIYAQQFDWLIEQMNKLLSPTAPTKGFIGILDIFGFENFPDNSFEQLCINFTNEKLQNHFNKHVFKLELDEYKAEQLQIDVADVSYVDNQICLDLIEAGRQCILAIVDDELRVPKANDDTLLEKLHSQLVTNQYYIKPKMKGVTFGVSHFAGNINYNITGFLSKNKDQLDLDLALAFASSSSPYLKELMTPLADSTKVQSTTLGAKFKHQLNSLVSVLSASDSHFVRCIKSNNKKIGDYFDGNMVLSQIRCLGLRDVVLIRQKGYPIRRPFSDFLSRYKLLLPSIAPQSQSLLADINKNALTIITIILSHFDPRLNDFKMGKSKIFYRMQIQTKLEQARDDALSQVVLELQTLIRCRLERKRFLRRNQILVKLRAAAKSTDLKQLDAIVDECERMSVSANGNSEISQLYKQCIETRNRLSEQMESLTALKKAMGTKDIEMLLVALLATRNAFAQQCGLKVINARLKVHELNAADIPPSVCKDYASSVELVKKLKEFEDLTAELITTRDLQTAQEVVQMSKQLDFAVGVISRWENFYMQIKEERKVQSQIFTANSQQGYEQWKKLSMVAIQQQSVVMLSVLLQRAVSSGFQHDPLYSQAKQVDMGLNKDITAMTLAKELKSALDSNDVDIIKHAINIALTKGFGAHDLVAQCKSKFTILEQEKAVKMSLQQSLVSAKRLAVESAIHDADKFSKIHPAILQSEEYLQATRVLGEMKEKQKKFNHRASVHARRSVVGHTPLTTRGGGVSKDMVIAEGDEDGDFNPDAMINSRNAQLNGIIPEGVDIWATASIDELQIALAEAESAGLDDQHVKQIKTKLHQLQLQRQALDLLSNAIESNNVRMLQASIDRAEKAGLSHQNDLFARAVKMLSTLRDKRAARGAAAGIRASIFGTGGQSLLTLTDLSPIREINIDTFIFPLLDEGWYTSSEFTLQNFPYLRPTAEFLKSKAYTDMDKIKIFKHQTNELPSTMLQIEAYNHRNFQYNVSSIGSADNHHIPQNKINSFIAHACSLFKSIQAFMYDRKLNFPESLIAELILTCQSYPNFRDEVYMMLMKQLTDNPSPPSLLSGWRLLAILTRYIAPSPSFFPYIMRFIFSHTPQAQLHHDYELRVHLNPKLTSNEQMILRNTARYCLTMLPLSFKDALLIGGDLARRNIDHYTFYLPPSGTPVVGSTGQPADKSTADGIGRYNPEKIQEIIAIIAGFATKSMEPVLMHVYFPDGSAVAITVSPWDTPQDIVKRACAEIGILDDLDTLWLYEEYKYHHYALLPYENPIDIQRGWLDKSQKKRKLFKQSEHQKQSKFSRFKRLINDSLSSISEPNTVQGRNGLIVNKGGKRKICIRRRVFYNPIQLSPDKLMNLLLFFQTAADVNHGLHHVHPDSAAMLAKMLSMLLPKQNTLASYHDTLPPPPAPDCDDDDFASPPPPPPAEVTTSRSTESSQVLLPSGDLLDIDLNLPMEPPTVDLIKIHKPRCPPNLLVGKYKTTEKKFFAQMDSTQLEVEYLSIEQYVATTMQLPSFCAQFFQLEQNFDALLPKTCILAVNQTGIFVLDHETMASIEQYGLLQVLGWSSGPGRVTLHVKLSKPDRQGKTTRALRFETDRSSVGTEICNLLMSYAKDMLAKSKANLAAP